VEKKVLRNMQVLKDEGVQFGCITVLSRLNAPYIEDIYHFFEEIDTSFRLLPIYRTGYPMQQEGLALTNTEIVDSLKKVIVLWLASETDIQVLPIQDYITHVVRRLNGRDRWRRYYDKTEAEVVYIVDTDGSLYSNADAYDFQLCHGNIFEEPLVCMEKSEKYLRAVEAAHNRMRATCGSCHFYGACSGYFMAEATPEQREYDQEGHLLCNVVQPLQDFIEEILVCSGIVEGDLLLRGRMMERAGAPFTA